MRKPLQNVGASVRARLLNLSKQRNEPLELLFTHYTLGRLLYRLSVSKERDRFVLKAPCSCGIGWPILIVPRKSPRDPMLDFRDRHTQ
ncbi:hypothetical protein Q3C01_16265 [Bradyrhizobium sp. UFLA05-109]